MATKAGLAKQLRSRGIPVPKDGKVADYQHRLDTWLPGKVMLCDWQSHLHASQTSTILFTCLRASKILTGFQTVRWHNRL